jgi:competence protein ComEA
VNGSAEPIVASSIAPPPLVVATAIVDATSPPTPAHSSHATEDDPVFLNEATVDDLRRLPGIGEKRALAVLELRRKLGRFKQVEDLLRVKGIGRSTLRKLRPLVRIDHPVAEAGSP